MIAYESQWVREAHQRAGYAGEPKTASIKRKWRQNENENPQTTRQRQTLPKATKDALCPNPTTSMLKCRWSYISSVLQQMMMQCILVKIIYIYHISSNSFASPHLLLIK
jgi:hypothetical protein